MTTRGAIARERLERLLRVATCLAACGYGAQAARLAATARALRGDAQLWTALARHRGPAGRTLLMQAICARNMARTDFLLAHGADVEAQMPSGDTSLIAASYMGNLQGAAALLERGGTNVNAARGPDGMHALMAASQEGHLGLVQLLLAHGAEANKASHNGQTSLMAACNRGHLEAARCLVEGGGANVNAVKVTNGGTALGAASYRGHYDCVRYLIERGATAASAALVEACEEGHLEVARYLLEHEGAKADSAVPGAGISALLWACKSEDRLELVRLLVVRGGANVNAASNNRGVTALMGASMIGSLQLVQLLLLHGADRGAQCLSGHTALDYADGFPLVQAALRA